MKWWLCGLLGLIVGVGAQFARAFDIQARGLFEGAAVLVIDGRQQFLKVGTRSPEGVLLVAADPRRAVVEIDGKRHTLKLSDRIASDFKKTSGTEIAISRNENNQYLTNANINGKRVLAIVDTGANAVALNLREARQLDINYKTGTPTSVQTAGGTKNAYIVDLRSVDVGGIRVDHIQGFVIDGADPPIVLLGMTYLEHVNLRKEKGILYLKSKY